jgi:hypothetical protein
MRASSKVSEKVHDEDAVEEASLLGLNQLGRGAINLSLLIGTAVALFFVSCIAFLIFYYQTVPKVGVVEPVYLQYHKGHHPHASIGLDLSGAGLVTGQAYNVLVELKVPTSQVNKDLGNFMVELALVGAGAETLASVARPAILRYASPLVDQLSTLAGAAPVMLGIKDEVEIIQVPLLHDFSFESTWLSNVVSAEIQIKASQPLQVYACSIRFEGKWKGIVWLLRRFRFLSFVLFTALFYMSASVVAFGTWTALGFLSGSSGANLSQARGKRAWHQGKGQGTVQTSRDASLDRSHVDYTAGFPRNLPASVISPSERSATTTSTAGLFKFEDGEETLHTRRRGGKGKESAVTPASSVSGVHIKEESESDFDFR